MLLKEAQVAFGPLGELSSAMAVVAVKNGYRVRGWMHSDESFQHYLQTGESRHLPGVSLDGIKVTKSIAEAVDGAKIVFLAPKSENVKTVLQDTALLIAPDTILVTATKGFIEHKGQWYTPSQLVPGSRDRVVTMSGPNFADQIARGKITGTTIASHSETAVDDIKHLFHNGSFKVDKYSGRPEDLEIVGAYKNIVGLVMGFARTLKDYDENTGALILQKGLQEASLLCEATGGDRRAIMELCGIGDYGLLMNSTTSRNVEAGEDFGYGRKTLDQIMNSDKTIEGIEAAKAVPWFAIWYGLRLPLGMSAFKVLYRKQDPSLMVSRLLAT